MRVVLDTNVLISAALKDNSTPAIVVEIAEFGHTVLKSAATEEQLLDVLGRARFETLVPDQSRHRLVNGLLANGVPDAIEPDDEDEPAGQALALGSGHPVCPPLPGRSPIQAEKRIKYPSGSCTRN